MFQFFEWFVVRMVDFMQIWKNFTFTVPLASGGTITINYFALLIGFLVLGFVTSVFWKGAKT